MDKFAKFAATLLLGCGSALFCVGGAWAADDAQPVKNQEKYLSLQELLNNVKEGRVRDVQENNDRLKRFNSDKSQQQALLNDLLAEQKKAEALSQELEAQFNVNDESLADLENKLGERLGSIKELFGVLQQVSSDAHAQMSNSLTQLHYPERTAFLMAFANKMGQTKNLPKIAEIEQLWFELQREMIASGDVVAFKHAVVTTEGTEVEQAITRVGLFNLVADGHYLQFIPETGRVLEYGRQPHSRYTAGAQTLAEAEVGEEVDFAIDPTRGQLLSLLVKAPSLRERIDQGGIIGYIIMVLGLCAILLAIQRFVMLQYLGSKIKAQIKQPEKPENNPLGRILAVYEHNKSADLEAVELKLGEAILKEVPRINAYLPLLKIIAAIAPLLGLLGTVTGMIITFQAITLFGAGDPKLMANGISQALMTTVQGLCVAIPTLLLHNMVAGKAKHLSEILEQESVALVAAHSENQGLAAA